MKKIISLILFALLVVGVAAILPCATQAGGCDHYCQLVTCSRNITGYITTPGAYVTEVHTPIRCTGGSQNEWASCEEFNYGCSIGTATGSGRFYTAVGEEAYVFSFEDKLDEQWINDSIEKVGVEAAFNLYLNRQIKAGLLKDSIKMPASEFNKWHDDLVKKHPLGCTNGSSGRGMERR